MWKCHTSSSHLYYRIDIGKQAKMMSKARKKLESKMNHGNWRTVDDLSDISSQLKLDRDQTKTAKKMRFTRGRAKQAKLAKKAHQKFRKSRRQFINAAARILTEFVSRKAELNMRNTCFRSGYTKLLPWNIDAMRNLTKNIRADFTEKFETLMTHGSTFIPEEIQQEVTREWIREYRLRLLPVDLFNLSKRDFRLMTLGNQTMNALNIIWKSHYLYGRQVVILREAKEQYEIAVEKRNECLKKERREFNAEIIQWCNTNSSISHDAEKEAYIINDVLNGILPNDFGKYAYRYVSWHCYWEREDAIPSHWRDWWIKVRGKFPGVDVLGNDLDAFIYNHNQWLQDIENMKELEEETPSSFVSFLSESSDLIASANENYNGGWDALQQVLREEEEQIAAANEYYIGGWDTLQQDLREEQYEMDSLIHYLKIHPDD